MRCFSHSRYPAQLSGLAKRDGQRTVARAKSNQGLGLLNASSLIPQGPLVKGTAVHLLLSGPLMEVLWPVASTHIGEIRLGATEYPVEFFALCCLSRARFMLRETASRLVS